VLFLSCACVSVSRVLFFVGVCLGDLLIFFTSLRHFVAQGLLPSVAVLGCGFFLPVCGFVRMLLIVGLWLYLDADVLVPPPIFALGSVCFMNRLCVCWPTICRRRPTPTRPCPASASGSGVGVPVPARGFLSFSAPFSGSGSGRVYMSPSTGRKGPRTWDGGRLLRDSG